MTSFDGTSFNHTVRRNEDRRFVTGRGRYADDIAMLDLCHAVIVRADVAHAEIVAMDTDEAAAYPDVIAVFTGIDLAIDGLGDIPCESIPAAVAGNNWVRTPFQALVSHRVLAVGDAVAVVIAESRKAARRAAALVSVKYKSLDAVVSIDDALRRGVSQIYPEAPGNICFDVTLGDAIATEAAFTAASRIVEVSTRQPRLIGAALEPRCSIGSYNAYDQRWTLTTSTQNPHGVRRLLAEYVLRVPANTVRVIANDVGGGFGTKGRLYPEDVLVLWASRRLGRPVKWTSTRSESFLADFHGRDQNAEGRLAIDADGRILALDVVTNHNLGCRLGPATGVSPFLTARMIVGPYAIPTAKVRLRGVFTNTRTTTSYRGAGRPEATYFIERAIDEAARQLGIDAVTIRRRNLVKVEAMPFKTAINDKFDCGEFETVMDKALVAADWNGFAIRKQESEKRGKLLGRGICCFVEVAAISNERMEIRFDPTGTVSVLAGTFSHGQGHETLYAQLLSQWLGVSFDDVRLIQGDTDKVSHGGGTYASRSLTVGGSALRDAADIIVKKATDIAAWMMKVDAAEIEFCDGLFSRRNSNDTIHIRDVARASYQPFGFPVSLGVGLEAVGYFAATPQNYPNGCHIAEVEVDPDLCTVTIVRYVAADDVGTVINSHLLEGQLHGSTAQGIGQALGERIVYDSSGQLMTAAFLDYGLPRAHTMPAITSVIHAVPTATNPLGVKGGAEVGTIGAPAAISQAVADALSIQRTENFTMPFTPRTVFELLHRQTASPPLTQKTMNKGEFA